MYGIENIGFVLSRIQCYCKSTRPGVEGEPPATTEAVWSNGQLCAEHSGLSACDLLATEVAQWFPRIGEMVQCVEVSATTRADDLKVIPGTHMVEGEK